MSCPCSAVEERFALTDKIVTFQWFDTVMWNNMKHFHARAPTGSTPFSVPSCITEKSSCFAIGSSVDGRPPMPQTVIAVLSRKLDLTFSTLKSGHPSGPEQPVCASCRPLCSSCCLLFCNTSGSSKTHFWENHWCHRSLLMLSFLRNVALVFSVVVQKESVTMRAGSLQLEVGVCYSGQMSLRPAIFVT